MNLFVAEIVEATGGRLVRGNSCVRPVRVCTDTRILQPGDMFVAIRGGNFDGDNFAHEALSKGAAGIITMRDWKDRDLPEGGFVLRVEDSIDALGRLANAWRTKIDPVVIAITGSSGKTTTKDMTAHLCGARLPVLATEGNKNNHIGLPLTLLRLTENHSTAIVEMGMNHAGEIDALTRIADPHFGVLTNIGDAHLGNFESHEALIDAKGELFAAMRYDGTAIINNDCENVERLRNKGSFPRQIITFGESSSADIAALNVRAAKPFGYEFTLRLFALSQDAYLPVFGRYQISNALAASAAALLAGVHPDEIVERLGTFRPAAMRSQVENVGGIHIIEDCYNASPVATCAVISSFAQLANVSRRFLLFGDMAELGSYSEEGHRRVGVAAAKAKLDGVYCTGESSYWVAEEAVKTSTQAHHFHSLESATEQLISELRPGDALLVKGSRNSRMERAVEAIRAHYESIDEEALT